MSTEPESTEKSSEDAIRVLMYPHTFEDGRKVSGGYHAQSDSFVWTFVNKDGEKTNLRLSVEAQFQMFKTYARLLREETEVRETNWQVKVEIPETKVQSGKEEG